MNTGSTRLEFSSGVARFDAMGNLFVHLPHSPEDPIGVVLGDGTGSEPPPRDRRALVKGQAATVTARGVFPPAPELPRGSLVVTVQGYDSAVLRDDGTLEVDVGGVAELPGWLRAGERHVFRREGQDLRLWAKSALPEGIVLHGTEPQPASPSPAPAKATEAPRAEPDEKVAPAPPPKKPQPGPVRPDEARRADGTSRLAGCTGLLAFSALALSVIALSVV